MKQKFYFIAVLLLISISNLKSQTYVDTSLRNSIYEGGTIASPFAYALDDGDLVQFKSGWCDCLDFLDDEHLSFSGVNTAILIDSFNASIERRDRIPDNDVDTIKYNTTSLKAGHRYEWIMIGHNLSRVVGGTSLMCRLYDSYLNKFDTLNLNGADTVQFQTDSNIGSINQYRFMAIFKDPIVPDPIIILPVNFVSINASNLAGSIFVSWTVEKEVNIKKYVVERSMDGKSFNDVGSIGAGELAYTFVDESAGAGINYYRIVSVDYSGNIIYSKIVSVVKDAESAFVVYPNPVKYKELNVRMGKSGNYSLKLLSIDGKTMLNYSIINASTSIVKLPNTVTPGLYELQVNDGIKIINKKILIQ